MRNSIFLSLLLNLSVMFVEAVRADGPAWLRNFEQAAQEAKAGEKDLFVLFTGHGWCHACEVLDREVFQQQEFAQLTARDFVFVELDFNFDDSAEEEQRKATLMNLRSRYLAPAVPTVVLADTQGLPYAYSQLLFGGLIVRQRSRARKIGSMLHPCLRELRRADRHPDAIQLVNDLFKKRREAWLLLDAAESYIALENTEEALQVITEAEAEAQAEILKGSQRKADRDVYTHLSGRMVALKDDLAAVSRKRATEPSDEPKSR